jgi:hypothetical protein
MALVGAVFFSPIVPADSMAITLPLSSPQATVLEDATLPKPDTIGTMTEDQTSIEPIILRQEEEEPLLDEVWSLIDKYYIDRSFGGQDWKKVKEKYMRLSSKARNEDSKFQLVKEMVASLNDKYSRILDPAVSTEQFHHTITVFFQNLSILVLITGTGLCSNSKIRLDRSGSHVNARLKQEHHCWCSSNRWVRSSPCRP